MKIGKWISHIINGLLVAVLLVAVFLFIASRASDGNPSIFGYELKTVLSGSMEPAFKTGSIIAIKPGGDLTRFQEGDVITFVNKDNQLITHRIIEVIQQAEQPLYRTKGDHNDAPDLEPVLAQNVVGEWTQFTIPYLGYFLHFTTSTKGIILLLILPGIFLVLYSALSIWRGLSLLEKQNKQSSTTEETISSG